MGEETAALLRVLIYKIDNTTFGDDTPTIPQWTGPPHTIVQVQAILYASLAVSLLSAFLAMLGKQWLNQYASTDMRGTAIERSQNRQCKLDGIVAWHFNHVMESLPLMLQAALLLLGCALSSYLWMINTTVASVILGVTSSGIIFYIFIVIAGAASESCPYQTPGSYALRYLKPAVQRVFYSAASITAIPLRDAFKRPKTLHTIEVNMQYYHPWWSRGKIMPFLKDMIFEVPRALVIDVYYLVRAMGWILASVGIGAYHFCSTTAILLVSQLHGLFSTPEQSVDMQLTALDLRCILWMLQTSLDKTVHLSTLKHLVTMVTLPDFYPTLVTDCFKTFVGCIRVCIDTHDVVAIQGLEQLATVSALCLFNALSHLLIIDPTSSVLEDVLQQYIKIFPAHVNFHGHQSYHTVTAACNLLIQWGEHPPFQWSHYKPSTYEHTVVAHNLVRVAMFRYQRTQQMKVPRLILRFALHSLSLDPLPPTSVIADCLLIIATDLGCDVSDPGIMTSGKGYVCIWQVNVALTIYQCASWASLMPDNSESENNGRS